jgi:hypothetical protein
VADILFDRQGGALPLRREMHADQHAVAEIDDLTRFPCDVTEGLPHLADVCDQSGRAALGRIGFRDDPILDLEARIDELEGRLQIAPLLRARRRRGGQQLHRARDRTLVIAALQLLIGFGILARVRAAQVIGLIVVIMGAIVQLRFFKHYPAWAAIILVLDAVIIYALTVHADEFAGARRPR